MEIFGDPGLDRVVGTGEPGVSCQFRTMEAELTELADFRGDLAAN